MRTYRQIAEIILRQLAGGDVSQDFPIKPEEVYVRISQIIPFLIRKDFYETYSFDLNKELDNSIFSTFITEVQRCDSEVYIILPSKPIMIHGRGTPQVSYIKDRKSPITYIDGTQLRMYLNNGVLNEIETSCFYEKDEDTGENKIIFIGLGSSVKKLRVRMVQDASFIDIDTDIPLQDHLIEELIQKLYQWYNVEDKEVEDSVINNKNDKV